MFRVINSEGDLPFHKRELCAETETCQGKKVVQLIQTSLDLVTGQLADIPDTLCQQHPVAQNTGIVLRHLHPKVESNC